MKHPENLRAVAAALRASAITDLKFDMDTVVSTKRGDCGTAACVAGWTVAAIDGLPALRKLAGKHDRWLPVLQRARHVLGLDDEAEGDALFYPEPGIYAEEMPVELVANALDEMADAGKADPDWWSLLIKQTGLEAD